MCFTLSAQSTPSARLRFATPLPSAAAHREGFRKADRFELRRIAEIAGGPRRLTLIVALREGRRTKNVRMDLFPKCMMTALWVAVLVGPDAARAELVTYTFSGTVDAITDTSSDHYVPTSIQNGNIFVGTFTFNNSAPGTFSGSDAFYRGTALDLSASVTIDGRYTYTLTTPSSQDEIDILGNSFELFKRGPTVYTSFAPNPPFSHFEFLGQTQTGILSQAVVTGAGGSAGVSDQQTSGAPYYFVGASITSAQAVPEPSSWLLVTMGAASLLVQRRARLRP
jgi:hypothetical protein